MIEKKTDYNGHDIKMSKKKKNQQECADFSASTPGGHFWTWHKTSKTCFVKSSNSGKYAVGHAVSGTRECGIPGGRKTAKNIPFRIGNIVQQVPGPIFGLIITFLMLSKFAKSEVCIFQAVL